MGTSAKEKAQASLKAAQSELEDANAKKASADLVVKELSSALVAVEKSLTESKKLTKQVTKSKGLTSTSKNVAATSCKDANLARDRAYRCKAEAERVDADCINSCNRKTDFLACKFVIVNKAACYSKHQE